MTNLQEVQELFSFIEGVTKSHKKLFKCIHESSVFNLRFGQYAEVGLDMDCCSITLHKEHGEVANIFTEGVASNDFVNFVSLHENEVQLCTSIFDTLIYVTDSVGGLYNSKHKTITFTDDYVECTIPYTIGTPIPFATDDDIKEVLFTLNLENDTSIELQDVLDDIWVTDAFFHLDLPQDVLLEIRDFDFSGIKDLLVFPEFKV